MTNELAYNDNSVPFSAGVIVIGAATYIAEDITVTLPAKKIERPDSIGGPNGFVLVKGQPALSATLQIPAVGSAFPAIGATFVFTGTAAGNACPVTPGGAWVIDNISAPYRFSDYQKVTVTALQTLASIA